jgi:PleD family two-component response regulator
LLTTARDLTVPIRSGGSLHITASAGCTVRHPFGDNLQDALHLADQALFAAKRSGRDRVEMEQVSVIERPA